MMYMIYVGVTGYLTYTHWLWDEKQQLSWMTNQWLAYFWSAGNIWGEAKHNHRDSTILYFNAI